MKIKRHYGCNKDREDPRDYYYRNSSHFKLLSLPSSVNLVDKLPECWDQGQLGSCTGHGCGASLAFIHPGLMPSRLMIYYDGRELENNIPNDDGAQIRDVVKALADKGVCPESLWPYDISKFAVRPPDSAYQEAAKYKISNYFRVDNLFELKTSLAQGFPVVIGFQVFDNFESAQMQRTGILKKPGCFRRSIGGHCVEVIGYDDSKEMVFVRNSWGTSWGPFNGNFWMEYKYFNHGLVSDMWTIRA